MQFFASMKGVKIALIAVLVCSIIYLILVQCLPKCMNVSMLPLSILIGIFGIIVIASFYTKDQQSLRTIITIFMIVLEVFIVISIFRNCTSARVHGIFLNAASNVASWRKSTFFFVPLFLIILILFVGMVLFEFVGFWSNGRKIFLPKEYIYYRLYGFQFSTGVLVILIIQLLWGFSFIK